MKKITQFTVFGFIILAMVIGSAGCKKKEDPTKVVGTASFPAGTSGDLSNAKVSLYLTLQDWQNNTPVLYTTAVGSGASVTFEFVNLNAGNYYLDVWKDVDNSGTWTVNDFVGWYGSGGLGSYNLTPLQVTANNTFTANVSMYVLVPGIQGK
jgi:hypothetical protein